MKEVTMAFHHLRHLRPEVLTSINNFLQVLNSTVGPTTNVMLFGSTTDPNSPLHFGSDIDLLVATNPGTTNSLAFKRAVYQAELQSSSLMPYPPLSIETYSFDDLKWQVGPISAQIYCSCGIVVQGLDLPNYFREWSPKVYQPIDVRRSALRALIASWHKINRSVIFEPGQSLLPNTPARLLAILRLLRTIYWVVDDTLTFPPHHHQIVPKITQMVEVHSADLIRLLWEAILNPQTTPLPASFSEQCFILLDSLVTQAVEHFRRATGEENLWLDQRW